MSRQELGRVKRRIATAIESFCGARSRFHASELRQHVDAECGLTAPGSADRVLRDLRQAGKLNYRVIDRKASLYEVVREVAQ